MSYFALLIPLGLLGLLGIVALIIIYIIKPNYLVKNISSTFVWQLSLKYKRKKIPTSKLRNILIFLCQVLILAAITGILAKPAVVYEVPKTSSDIIAIIDSSASMYAGDVETRFERAVNRVIDQTNEVIADGANMSVILANGAPSFLGRRVGAEGKWRLNDALNELLEEETSCFYGKADMEKAMSLCEEILVDNPSALIYVYTDTKYDFIPAGIDVRNLSEDDEWNAAILNAYTSLEDNFYTLTIEVACYGNDRALDVNVQITGANSVDANDMGKLIYLQRTVDCTFGETQKLVFKYGGGEDSETVHYYDLGETDKFYSYQTIHISIDEEDSFTVDNSFDIYGGQKEILKVQYASGGEEGPNPFMSQALMTLAGRYRREGCYDMKVTEVKQGTAPEMSGFDVYIFEHEMPDRLPDDGMVFLLDPDSAPSGAGFRFRQTQDFNGQQIYLTGSDEYHPVLRNIIAEDVFVTRYTQLDVDDDYQTILYVNGYPAVMLEKEDSKQIAVFTFSVHYSNIAMQTEWFELIRNIFEYYFPYTVTNNSFEVGEKIELNCRGPELSVSNYENNPIKKFPTSITLNLPGTYEIEQTSWFDNSVISTEIFVKIPAYESNIHAEEEVLPEPYRAEAAEQSIDDLMIYLAAVLVAILFLEWWLQMREGR